jgi:hypothetical protein
MGDQPGLQRLVDAGQDHEADEHHQTTEDMFPCRAGGGRQGKGENLAADHGGFFQVV